MEFAPLPLEKQIKGVNQNWLNCPFALFQVVGPHLHKNVSPTTNISCSLIHLIHFYHPKHCWKRITGNEKNLWNCFWCSGDLGGSKYLLSQMTKKKKKKRLILIKKAGLKKKKNVRTKKICKTCVRTTRACNRKKKKEFAKYIICGLQ